MHDAKETQQKIPVERVFDHSRLGPELMAAAYEWLVPIHRMALSGPQHPQACGDKEERQCAV